MLSITMGVWAGESRRLAPALALVIALGVSALSPAGALAQTADARPWLGVAMDSEEAGQGVRVGHVVRGSPADRAGLREGDRILRIAAERVSRGQDVVRAVATHAVGGSLDVTFARDGKEQVAHAVLTALPSQDEISRMDLVGAFAPSFRDLEPVSGSFPPSIAALRGRVVLIDFWATWCGPCRVVIPKLAALQSRYGAQGLSVLGVSTEGADEVAAFAQRMAMPYGVAVDKHALTTRSYGVVSLPTVVVIDKRGVVRDLSIGYDGSEGARLESTVRALLAEPAASD